MEGQDLIGFEKPRSIVAVRDDASFRTNLILCGTAEFVSVDVDVSLILSERATLGTRRYRLPPFGMIQVSHDDDVPALLRSRDLTCNLHQLAWL